MKRNISNNIEINHKLNLTKRGFHFHVNERQETEECIKLKAVEFPPSYYTISWEHTMKKKSILVALGRYYNISKDFLLDV